MTTATRKRRATKTLESIIGSALRPRVPGAFYKLAPASPSLAIDSPKSEVPYVDRATMSARAIISTPVMDRVGDVLIPEGIRLDNYRRNPVVLWAHGFDGITTPIGKSEDPDGNLTVRIQDGHVEATCFFSQSNLEASQIFELVAEGVVRATSVRETPVKSSYSRDPDFGDYLLVEEWDLEEWSWCCVGVNPEAVAKATEILKRGRLDGKSIAPSIMKSLSALCPEAKILGKGCDMTTKTEGTSTATKSEKAEKPEKEDPSKKPAEDVASTGDTEATEAEGTDGEEGEGNGEDTSKLYGHQFTTAAHGSVTDCIKAMQAGVVPCENDTVRKGMTDVIDSMKDIQTAIVGVHKKAYPSSKALDSEPDGDEPDAEGMKAWLAQGKGRDHQVWGVASRLKTLAAAKNLTAEQRRLLLDCDRHLDRMAAQCKAALPKKTETKAAQDSEASAQAKEIADLQKKLDELTKLEASLK